jgi:hypothetical protein
VALSIITLKYTYRVIGQANELARAESAVAWQLPRGAHLRPGPTSFYYDAAHQQLRYRGVLGPEGQLQLRDLLEFDGRASAEPAPQPASAPAASASAAPAPARASAAAAKAAGARQAASRPGATAPAAAASPASRPEATASAAAVSQDQQDVERSYHAAVGLLAYESQASEARQIQLLLLLGILGGALGAFLRSFVDFVGNACYKNALDLVIWWPLYATRPIVGAVLGFLLVVLFKARLISNSDAAVSIDSFWWLGVAAIGGFSTIDVTARLRQAAKALFGGNSGKEE